MEFWKPRSATPSMRRGAPMSHENLKPPGRVKEAGGHRDVRDPVS